MTIAAVRTAMASAINGVEGVRCGTGGYVRDSVAPPEAFISVAVVGDATFAQGAYDHLFRVTIWDKRTSERAAQIRLDQWRDPKDSASVWRAIEDNTDLAAVCHFAKCQTAGEPEVFTTADGVEYLVVTILVGVVI